MANKHWTLDEIVEANEAAGRFYFSEDSLGFFGQTREDFEVFQVAGLVFVFADTHRGWDTEGLSTFAEFDPKSSHLKSVSHPNGISEQWSRDEIKTYLKGLRRTVAQE